MTTTAPGAPASAQDLATENDRLRTAVATLERNLDSAREEHRRVGEQLVAANQGSSDMLKLSVALCRLYESADRESALAGLREIVINVIGSESFVVLTVGEGGALTPLTSMGVSDAQIAWHRAGAGVVGEVARGARRHVGTPRVGASGLPEAPELVACVPLALGSRTEAVLAIHALLPHKLALEPFDLDILDLLTTHAMGAMRVAALRSDAAAA